MAPGAARTGRRRLAEVLVVLGRDGLRDGDDDAPGAAIVDGTYRYPDVVRVEPG